MLSVGAAGGGQKKILSPLKKVRYRYRWRCWHHKSKETSGHALGCRMSHQQCVSSFSWRNHITAHCKKSSAQIWAVALRLHVVCHQALWLYNLQHNNSSKLYILHSLHISPLPEAAVCWIWQIGGEKTIFELLPCGRCRGWLIRIGPRRPEGRRLEAIDTPAGLLVFIKKLRAAAVGQTSQAEPNSMMTKSFWRLRAEQLTGNYEKGQQTNRCGEENQKRKPSHLNETIIKLHVVHIRSSLKVQRHGVPAAASVAPEDKTTW